MIRFLFLFLLGLGSSIAAELPVPCPDRNPCKILILTPQEEQALTMTNGILATAEQGRPLDLGFAVRYFQEKLKNAPPGMTSPPAAADTLPK